MVQYQLWRPTADAASGEHQTFQKSPCRSGGGHMRAQEIYGRYRVLIAAIAARAEWTADWIGDLRHTVRLFESEMGHLEQVNAQQLRNKLCVQLEQEASLLGGGRRRQAFLAAAKFLKVDA
jgi:hypothetical protein